MIWRSTTLRGRLTLWYTGILTATFAVLGTTSVLLLDRGLRQNVDDSLDSVANAIADSVQRPSFFGPELEEYLQSMLGPELAERFFQLLDPLGRPTLVCCRAQDRSCRSAPKRCAMRKEARRHSRRYRTSPDPESHSAS